MQISSGESGCRCWRATRRCAEMAATWQRRRRRGRGQNNVEKRAARAHSIVLLGELSSARQALEGTNLALCNDATLRALRRRPARPQERIRPALMHLRPRPFDLDEKLLGKNSAKRGACARAFWDDDGAFASVVGNST